MKFKSPRSSWGGLFEPCFYWETAACATDLAYLFLRSCRIPPDLTQECVLGDDEGRIWYWPLEIVDIPGSGGTKRCFCFPWSPSSGINAASCNLSLEPSKTLRHLMTLQGRLSSPWRGGKGKEKGWGGGCLRVWHRTVHIQLCSACGRNLYTQPLLVTVLAETALRAYVSVQVLSPKVKSTEKWLHLRLGVGDFTASTTPRTVAPSFAHCTNKPLETPGQIAQLWGMKNNLVPNVVFFNTPFIVGCRADPLGNNVAFCVGSASPPFSLPCAEK